MLSLLIQAGASAQLLPPLPIGKDKQTPKPSPSPSPSQSPSSRPSTRPSPKSSTTPTPKGPAPTPYNGLRSAIGYVLDIAGTARNTQPLLDLLARLQPAGAPLTPQEMALGFGRFPVVGYVWYHDDYGAPRLSPYFHLHEGVDLFAVAGTPVIACVDGVISKTADGSIGGTSFWLQGDDGITYYYGHLQGYAPGVVAGKRVRVGEVLGYVGDTGVALGTYPHLHFEMHPGGGPPVSPKPVLDAWLNAAESSAVNAYARLVEYNALNRIGAARWQRMFDLMREPAAPLSRIWTAAVAPTAVGLGLDSALDAIAWGLDPQSFVTGAGTSSVLAASVADVMYSGIDRVSSGSGSILASPGGALAAGH
jgi:murein DD-endopeptidase MepM/ murein hydrolase activator NlpD